MTSEELKFFDTIAPKWDEMEVYSTSEKVAELIDLTGIREGYDVLDLGTKHRSASSGIVGARGTEGDRDGGGLQRGYACRGAWQKRRTEECGLSQA